MGKPAFGDELRKLREQRGLSLKKFAYMVHYDPGYLSKIENGIKPPTTALAANCDPRIGEQVLGSSSPNSPKDVTNCLAGRSKLGN